MKSSTGWLAVLLVAAMPALAAAQQKPALEAGTYVGLGVTKVTGESGSTKMFSVPTGTLYLAFFPTDKVFVEPEIALAVASDDGTATSLGLNVWFDVAPAGVNTNSLYIGAAPALQRYSYSSGGFHDSESQYGIAGRVGYRILASEGFAVRIEAGYEHWLEKDDNPSGNVFTVRVGLGGVLHRAM